MTTEQRVDCWICREAPMPKGPQRSALCSQHSTEFLTSLMRHGAWPPPSTVAPGLPHVDVTDLSLSEINEILRGAKA